MKLYFKTNPKGPSWNRRLDEEASGVKLNLSRIYAIRDWPFEDEKRLSIMIIQDYLVLHRGEWIGILTRVKRWLGDKSSGGWYFEDKFSSFQKYNGMQYVVNISEQWNQVIEYYGKDLPPKLKKNRNNGSIMAQKRLKKEINNELK